MTFQDIIDGKGQYRTFQFKNGTEYTSKEIADHIKCVDGTELSVQASNSHYCTPRSERGPYSHVEVGYPTETPPESWAKYADGEYPSDVYGYVPVEMIQAFIDLHGGEAKS